MRSIIDGGDFVLDRVSRRKGGVTWAGGSHDPDQFLLAGRLAAGRRGRCERGGRPMVCRLGL